MNSIEKIVKKMRESPQNVRFSELVLVCNHFFGDPRKTKVRAIMYIKHPGMGILASTFRKDKAEKQSHTR